MWCNMRIPHSNLSKTSQFIIKNFKLNYTLSKLFYLQKRNFTMSRNFDTEDNNAAIIKMQSLLKSLNTIAPSYVVDSNEISILTDPKDFYKTLKEKILSAKKKIFLSTLYIGKSEDELIDCLSESLSKNPNLKVEILLDRLRGTREAPEKCSATMLTKLIKNFGNDRIQIRMYLTPNLPRWKFNLLPKRIIEGWGLQHMKLYGFDDEILLSGANLSNDYFTNRQDRYYLFSNKFLTQYYYTLHKTISSISYLLTISDNIDNTNMNNFSLVWPKTNNAPDPLIHGVKNFVKSTSILMSNFLINDLSKKDDQYFDFSKPLTVVYPISQFSPLFYKKNFSTENKALNSILEFVSKSKQDYKWTFTAGYFNILPQYIKLLLNSNAKGSVIVAAPEANGFYKSKGISGALPGAYLLLAKEFFSKVKNSCKENQIKVYEWQKGIVNTPLGWSYHAKGIWVDFTSDNNNNNNNMLKKNLANLPTILTIIGSSNYTKRSLELDLESNALILTSDKNLSNKIKAEENNLFKNTKVLSEKDFNKSERHVPIAIRFATWVFGGKL